MSAGGGGTAGIMDYTNPSCHSPSATMSIPSHIFSMAATHLSIIGHLFHSQESWRHASKIIEQHRGEHAHYNVYDAY